MNTVEMIMCSIVAVLGGLWLGAAMGLFDRTASREWIELQLKTITDDRLRSLVMRRMQDDAGNAPFTRHDIRRIVREARIEKLAIETAADQLSAISE